MSQTTPHLQGQAEDRINYGVISAVAIVSLVIFAIGVVWADRIMVATADRIGEPLESRPVPKEIGRPEIGIVDQQLFNHDMRAEHMRAQKLEQLRSYGWVDRARGVAHVPVEQAMQRLVQQGGSAPTAPLAPQNPEAIPGGGEGTGPQR
ncbi:MAG: hypothetical protein ACK4N5_14480 [Myxococcales bacterium]